jgi:serine/threonine protein kinase
VLYEITGLQLFPGEDISEVLASVIMKEPDLEPMPPKVRRVLRRCLEKDPKNRLRDISGVALLLEQEPAPTVSVSAPPRTSRATFLLDLLDSVRNRNGAR